MIRHRAIFGILRLIITIVFVLMCVLTVFAAGVGHYKTFFLGLLSVAVVWLYVCDIVIGRYEVE